MVDRVRSSAYVFIFGFLLSFSGWYFGYVIGMFNSFFKPFMQVVYKDIPEDEHDAIQGNIQLFLMIGGMASCLTAGYIIETLGRYKSVIFYIIAEICVLALSMQTSLYVLYAVRFFHGYVACSWTFLGPLMMKEILPETQKKLFSGMFYIFITLGIMTSYSFSSEKVAEYWRIVFLLPGIFDIPKLLAFLFIFKIESPKWICTKVKNTEQRQYEISQSLKKIYVEEDVDRMTNFLMDETASTGKVEEVEFGDLVGPQYRFQFCLVIFLNFLNQMTGINFLIMYSKKIFDDNNVPHAAEVTLGMGFVNTFGAIVITIAAQKFSKKTGLVSGLALQAVGYFVFLLGITFENSIMIVFGVYFYIFNFAISLGALLYPYQADILPAGGIGIASFIQWIIGAIVGKFATNIIDFFGGFYVFLFFMIMGVIGSIIIAGFGIVTENKTDEQIKNEFANKTFMS